MYITYETDMRLDSVNCFETYEYPCLHIINHDSIRCCGEWLSCQQSTPIRRLELRIHQLFQHENNDQLQLTATHLSCFLENLKSLNMIKELHVNDNFENVHIVETDPRYDLYVTNPILESIRENQNIQVLYLKNILFIMIRLICC